MSQGGFSYVIDISKSSIGDLHFITSSQSQMGADTDLLSDFCYPNTKFVLSINNFDIQIMLYCIAKNLLHKFVTLAGLTETVPCISIHIKKVNLNL